MLINKTDYDLKYRLRNIVYPSKHQVEFKEIENGIERILINNGTLAERSIMETLTTFACRLHYRANGIY